jgi:hypothetical protein
MAVIGLDLADHPVVVFEPLFDERNGILEAVNAHSDGLDLQEGSLSRAKGLSISFMLSFVS